MFALAFEDLIGLCGDEGGSRRNKPTVLCCSGNHSFFLTPQIQNSHYQVEPEQSGMIQTLLDRLLGQSTMCVKHQNIVYPLIANVCGRCKRGRRDTEFAAPSLVPAEGKQN